MSFESLKHLLWWVFVGTRGGPMRKKIMLSLLNSPANANQLAERLGVNYRTILHHIRILEENGLVKSEGPKYGKVYFPTDLISENMEVFNSVLSDGWGRKKR